MHAELGISVVTSDSDLPANLTGMSLDEELLGDLWQSERTVYGWLRPLLRGVGDISTRDPVSSEDGPALLVGDLHLSEFEEELSSQWPSALGGNERAFRVLSAFRRLMQNAARGSDAGLILLDLGPNLGAINRASLISADYVVIPMSPDLFSLQGPRNLGGTLPVDEDPNRPALLEHYRSLMPLAQEARKPIFHLEPADGAIGSHAVAAHNVYRDLEQLAVAIAERTALHLPSAIR